MPWLHWTLGAILTLAGLTLLLRALFADRSRGRRRCPHCWYDLSATPGLTCAECGRTARSEHRLHRTHRHHKLATAALALTLAGTATAAWPHLSGDQWRTYLPSTALIAILPHTEGTWAFETLEPRLWTHPSGPVQIHHRDALWDWQWRWLARTCGNIAASDPDQPRASRALVVLFQLTPDPTPGLDGALRALKHPNPRVQWLAIWSLKAARFDLADHTGRILEHLNAIDAEPRPDFPALADTIALYTPLARPRPLSPDVPLTPDAVTAHVQGQSVASLADIYRQLGRPLRILTWSYSGEAGPLNCIRYDLELDGQPGDDRILGINSGPDGGHWAFLTFLRRGEGWRSAGAFELANPVFHPPDLFVAGPAEAPHLVVRAASGWGADGAGFLYITDSWLRIEEAGPRLVLHSPVGGHNLVTAQHPTWINARMIAEPPRALTGPAVEYRLRAIYAAGWDKRWSDLQTAAQPFDAGPLFERQGAIRYTWSPWRGRFIHDPTSDWTEAEAEQILLGGPDEFIADNTAQLAALARTGTPQAKRWIELLLTTARDSPEKRTIQQSLD